MCRSTFLPTIILAILCLLSAASALADTIYVPADAPSIQDGINQAVAGDSVVVACGTYQEHDIRMKSGVQLLSETGLPECVTIDAQQLGRVILCRFTARSTRIEGFTITNGFVPYNPEGGDDGGGIYCLDNSSPEIIRCVITGNFANFDGGGVACVSNSSPTLVGCSITNNEAGNGGSGLRCNYNSNPILQDCEISDNDGTGIWTGNFSSPELTGCTISGNSSSGIYHAGPPFGEVAVMTLVDCVIEDNAGFQGGGLRLWHTEVTLDNCSILKNRASGDGGGLSCDSASATLVKCVVTQNAATRGGGFRLVSGSLLTATDVQFSRNRASGLGDDGFVSANSQATLRCSVETLDGFEGTGTIVLDNEGCLVPTLQKSLGDLKALFGRSNDQ